LARLKVYEGVPPPYDRVKRVVVPQALRVLRLKPMRRFTHLGTLAHEIGWHYQDVVSKLEARRKVKAAAWYARRKETGKVHSQAIKATTAQNKNDATALLAQGYY